MCFLRGAFPRWKSSVVASRPTWYFFPDSSVTTRGAALERKQSTLFSMKMISIMSIVSPIIKIGFFHLPEQSLDLFQFVPEMYHFQ